MAELFEDAEIAIPCPKCGQKHKKSVRWIRANKELSCPCGAVVALEADELLEGIEQADEAIDKFGADIKAIGKRLKF